MTTNEVLLEVEGLRRDIMKLAEMLAPWIEMAEMGQRYSVCSKTLLKMERAGDIPTRVRGRWRRTDVMEMERGKRIGV